MRWITRVDCPRPPGVPSSARARRPARPPPRWPPPPPAPGPPRAAAGAPPGRARPGRSRRPGRPAIPAPQRRIWRLSTGAGTWARQKRRVEVGRLQRQQQADPEDSGAQGIGRGAGQPERQRVVGQQPAGADRHQHGARGRPPPPRRASPRRRPRRDARRGQRDAGTAAARPADHRDARSGRARPLAPIPGPAEPAHAVRRARRRTAPEPAPFPAARRRPREHPQAPIESAPSSRARSSRHRRHAASTSGVGASAARGPDRIHGRRRGRTRARRDSRAAWMNRASSSGLSAITSACGGSTRDGTRSRSLAT